VSELVFLLSADADIQAEYEFYEKYQPGRGEIFMKRLDEALGRILAFPEAAPIFHEPYRRLLISGLPCGVFYTLEKRGIVVVAVIDLRQDPRKILQRLRPPE